MKAGVALFIGLLFFVRSIQAETYSVTVEQITFAPYIMTDHQGNFNGYLFDLMEAWKEDQGIELIYQVTPIKRIGMMAKNDRVDFVLPDHPKWSARDYKEGRAVIYSRAIADVHGGFARLSEAPEIMNIEDRIPVIGSLLGFSYDIIRRELENHELEIHEVAQTTSLVGLLKARRVDAVFGNVPSLIKLGENTLGKNSVVQAKTLPDEHTKYYLSSIKSFGLIQDFNSWLIQKSTEKKLAKLKEKWGI